MRLRDLLLCNVPNGDMKIAENSASSRGVLMQKPELLSRGAAESPARLIEEMSRLYYLSRAIHVAALAYA
jgi:hypothetical protein